MPDGFKGLRLYNTMSRTKQDFAPLNPARVTMYVCGPTVYDFAHIGNARPVIVFDVLFRLLRHLYGESHVVYVRNITDIDDKINARALSQWTKATPLLDAVKTLTDVTAAQYQADARALGALEPSHEPRATAFVAAADQPADMIRIIARLAAQGHAYAAEGHVLFDTRSMPDYGALSRRSSDDMSAGARVEVAPYKRGPMDFVLWKPSNPETEPGWESPWGFGRPGWHIECSAMAGALLGDVIDIHAGGLDLIFPHHENEIAQSRCASGLPQFAQVWMHNGFLQVESEKMSKSTGNFITINELLTADVFGGRAWPGEVLRLAMLRTHYRQPIDWTVKALEEAEKTLQRWSEIAATAPDAAPSGEFIAALCDDLNTAQAITVLHELARKNPGELKASLALIGFAPAQSMRAAGTASAEASGTPAAIQWPPGIDGAHASALLTARLVARAAKNWAESDRLRGQLAALGVIVKDNKDGTQEWSVKR